MYSQRVFGVHSQHHYKRRAHRVDVGREYIDDEQHHAHAGGTRADVIIRLELHHGVPTYRSKLGCPVLGLLSYDSRQLRLRSTSALTAA